MAMSVVVPPGVFHHRVETDTVYGHAVRNGGPHFFADVSKPAGPRLVFSARLGHEQRPQVTCIDFPQNVAEWAVFGFTTPYGVAEIPPLVAIIKIYANNLQKVLIAAEVGVHASR